MEFWRTFCKDGKKKCAPKFYHYPWVPWQICCIYVLYAYFVLRAPGEGVSRRRRLMVAGCCFWVWQTNLFHDRLYVRYP